MISLIRSRIQAFNARRELLYHAPTINRSAQGKSSNELFDLITGAKYNRFFWIKQVREEFLGLCEEAEKLKPENLLEIGTASGGSLFAFCKLAHPNAHIISIDLPGGKFGGGYPDYRGDFYKTFAGQAQTLTLLRTDSQKPETVNILKTILADKPLDFLFIDGDHSYTGVKSDFENYAPLVRKGGIVAFHDIAEHPAEWGVGVKKYWDEIKSNYTHKELVADINQGWAGIGILYI